MEIFHFVSFGLYTIALLLQFSVITVSATLYLYSLLFTYRTLYGPSDLLFCLNNL